MNCPTCNNPAKKFGKDRKGQQRYRCLTCDKTFQEPKIKPLDNMILAEGKALVVLQHLIEGCSVRSTERLTSVHRDTILNLLTIAGRKCEALMFDRIHGLSVKDVECDELWAFIGMKAKAKDQKGLDDPTIGDVWTFTAIERHSKLILAWHLGHRTHEDTVMFTEKLAWATEGDFQITTDGFAAYRDAVVLSLGAQHVDFAQLIKIYTNNPSEPETRYSPAQCVVQRNKLSGVILTKIAWVRRESNDITFQLGLETRRFTRLTNAFSKKWEKHHAALALYFAYHNFCRMHKTLRCTPAMAQGIVKSVWTVKDLLGATARY